MGRLDVKHLKHPRLRHAYTYRDFLIVIEEVRRDSQYTASTFHLTDSAGHVVVGTAGSHEGVYYRPEEVLPVATEKVNALITSGRIRDNAGFFDTDLLNLQFKFLSDTLDS